MTHLSQKPHKYSNFAVQVRASGGRYFTVREHRCYGDAATDAKALAEHVDVRVMCRNRSYNILDHTVVSVYINGREDYTHLENTQ